MAAISVTASVVRVARADGNNYVHAPANADLTRGTVVVQNSSGKWVAGNGGGTLKPHILLHTVKANYAATAVGGDGAILDVGDGLPAVGSEVFATTAGGLDTVTTSNQKIGEVISVQGQAFGDSAKKLLRLA